MTSLNIEKIGLVADYSKQGDWAFEFAFGLARSRGWQLNIFHFLESPYEVPQDLTPGEIPVHMITGEELVAKDRKLREYFDRTLGDYVDVGFRVCENARHNLELKRCLKEKEYQVLVIPYLRHGVSFGNMPIEEFAYRFNAPLILVGPSYSEEYRINDPAKMLLDSLRLPLAEATLIGKPETFQHRAVL